MYYGRIGPAEYIDLTESGGSMLRRGRWAGRLAAGCMAALLCPWLNAQGTPLSEIQRRFADAREQRLRGHADQALSELSGIRSILDGTRGSDLLKAEVAREQGEIHMERREWKAAAASFEASLQSDARQGGVSYQLGLALRNLGDSRQAAVQLESALANGYRNLSVTLNLIAAYFDSRQPAAALNRANQMISAPPKSADALLRLGRLLFERLYYGQALKAFRLALEQAPAEFEPRFYLALTHFLLNQYDESIQVLSQGPRPNEGGPEAANLLAASEAGKGDIEKAVIRLRGVIGNAPGSPHAYLNLALILLDEGHPGEAERLFDKFRALGPQRDAKVFYRVKVNSCPQLTAEIRTNLNVHRAAEKGAFYYDLAVQMLDRYHYSSALELLRLARRYEGSSARLLQAAGLNCLNLAPNAPEAVWLLREAVERDPGRHAAWHLLGRACMRQGNFEEALAAFRKAVSLEPRAAYLLSLGRALLSASPENIEDARLAALAVFEQAAALVPADAMARYELGRLLAQMERFEQARAHLTRAVDIEPDFYEAYYLLARVSSRSGDRQQSQKYLTLFESTRRAVTQQSVAGSGYIHEGREP